MADRMFVGEHPRKKIDRCAVFNTACCCIGPQGNDPVCPCRMRNVKVLDGRYVEIRDLGPTQGKADFDRLITGLKDGVL